MHVTISRVAHAEMLAHARETPAIEVCGLLLGHDFEIKITQRCANISDCPETSFEIDPATLIAAHRAQRTGGMTVIGHYHSHPNGVLALSERDRRDAGQGQIMIVVAGGRIGTWRSDQGISHVPLHVLP